MFADILNRMSSHCSQMVKVEAVGIPLFFSTIIRKGVGVELRKSMVFVSDKLQQTVTEHFSNVNHSDVEVGLEENFLQTFTGSPVTTIFERIKITLAWIDFFVYQCLF